MWQELIDDMERVLVKLDDAGFGLAAVHVSTALDHLRSGIQAREKSVDNPLNDPKE